LSISYGIIKRHNGEIYVNSRMGVGTTFTIELPSYTSKEDTDEWLQSNGD
jgi:two-component system, NtrC family, sensor kinase